MISNWGVYVGGNIRHESVNLSSDIIGLNDSVEFNLNMVGNQYGAVTLGDLFYYKRNYVTISIWDGANWVDKIYNNGQSFILKPPGGDVTITIVIESSIKTIFPSKTGRLGNVKQSNNNYSGGNIWQRTNLNVTTYRDGTPLIDASNYTNSQWLGLIEGAWCYPNNRINYDYIDSFENILLDDNFDYLATTNLSYQSTIDYLGNPHQWLPHTLNEGINPIKIVPTGLTFTNYNQVLTNNSISLNYSGESIYNTFNGLGSDNIYCSFVIKSTRLTNNGGRFFSLRESKDGDERGRVFIIPITTSTFKFGLSFDSLSPTIQTTSVYNFNEIYLVVVKYSKTTSTVCLYAFKEFDELTLEPSTPTIGPLTGSQSGITPNIISFNQGIGVISLVDGLRVSSIWNIKITIGNEPGYGRLYNSYAVNDTSHGGLAPDGYRIPTSVEWDNLITSIGGLTSGPKMCEVGSKHWIQNKSFITTDTIGLSILPAGVRGINQVSGVFEYEESFKYLASFWTSKGLLDYNKTITINSFGSDIEINVYKELKNGLSVRCIVDDFSNLPPISTPTQNTLICLEFELNSNYYEGVKAIKTNESSSVWLLNNGRKYGFISWAAWKAYGLDNSPPGGDNYTNSNNWTIVSVDDANSIPDGGWVDENGVINNYEEQNSLIGDNGCYFYYLNCEKVFVTVFVGVGTYKTVYCYPNTSPILSNCSIVTYSEIYRQ